MKSNKKYGVITGASQGLGRAFAFECASIKMNLILISLPNEGISTLARELTQKFQIKTVIFEGDLTQKSELVKLLGTINDKFRVKVLINNAGIGGSNRFLEVSDSYLDQMILLNIRALVILTHGLLENLKENGRSYILNIASLASFGPMPLKTVYPASKAFVYSFSRGLNTELKGSGVSVSVVHPGGIPTNENVSKRIANYNKLIRSTILSADEVARISIRQMLKRDALIIPGFMNKISWVFFKTVPVWLRLIIFRKSIQKELHSDVRK